MKAVIHVTEELAKKYQEKDLEKLIVQRKRKWRGIC